MPDLLASLQDVLGDRYQLEGELGHGGMATVYRAIDRKLDRAVAIKVLSPELALILGSDRFRREIAIATQLTHPNIVPLLDSGGEAELLYYVMPLIDGETLRDLLLRETQLPLEEALRIARAVAAALGYAHARGIVHRDIKPENILLSAGQVYVADFGIARAITLAGDDRLTTSGMVPGTPPYMSPEQADGKVTVDGRSDLYALGCVLYEMLAGQPPFMGPTAQSVLAQHLSAPVPSLRIQRSTVPSSVEAVILKLLSKVPADRFATASRMVAALDGSVSGSAPAMATPRIGHFTGLLGALLVLAGWLSWPGSSGRLHSAAPDTTAYAVFPFEHQGDVRATLPADRLLHDALARWTGIRVMDQRRVRETVTRRGAAPLNTSAAFRAARELGVARYVRGVVSVAGDSLRIEATLYDGTTPDSAIRTATVRLPADGRTADAAARVLADSLLLGGLGIGADSAASWDTRSLPALEAFARGQAALVRWDLSASDSAFARASELDAGYSGAFLWLALVRFWRAAPLPAWQSAAVRAAAGRVRLTAHDQAATDALLALAGNDRPRACGDWRRLTRQSRFDFSAWFSLAQCLIGDSIVLRDNQSPTGWRFRSSYQEALQSYENAFQLHPWMCRALRDRAYASVRDLFFTRRNTLRHGFAQAPDTLSFAAYPAWIPGAESLAFVPRPRADLLTSRRDALGASLAVQRERSRFFRVALSWATNLPDNSDALAALGIAMDVTGDPAGLDTLARALRVARTADDSNRIHALEIWMEVRASLPDDGAGIARVAARARTILAGHLGSSEAMLFSSIAALTGRAGQAARLAMTPGEHGSSTGVADAGYPLMTFAALGGPPDSVRRYAMLVQDRIAQAPAEHAEALRAEWLVRAATLLYPDLQIPGLSGSDIAADPLMNAQEALRQGDAEPSRRMLQTLDDLRARRALSPGQLTFDEIYPEAILRERVAGSTAAGAWLDSALAGIGASEPGDLADPILAGAMVRSMALRADLADRAHDHATAARWARAVTALWTAPDPVLRPLVMRMRALAR